VPKTLRAVAILVLVLFLMSTFCVPISASDVSVGVQGGQVHARYALYLRQNVTALPNMTATIDSTTRPDIYSVFGQALKNTNPEATPSDLQLDISSTKALLNLTCTMDVSGVSQRSGDILAVNMTWLPFNINSDLQAGNFSFNTIGKRYMRPILAYYANASRFVGLPNVTITGATFFVNKTSIGPQAAVNYVGNFTMLDFRSLNPTIDQWNRTYTVTNDTTSWRYSPAERLDFELQIQRGNATHTAYTASYGYNATVSVSGVGRVKGDTLLVGVGTGKTEWTMAAIVVLVVLCAVGVQILFRNRKKKITKFQRR